MFAYRKTDKKGFTLIELIIAIALLSVVSAIGYSLMNYSQVTLKYSDSQSDIQNDIRLASSYLSKEIKFATEMKIMTLSDCISEINAHAAYDYFYIDGGSLHQAKYVDATTYVKRAFSSFLSSSDSSFNKVTSTGNPKNTLNLTLTANDNGKLYNISTNIVLENFPIINASLAIDGTTGLAIRYKTKEPQWTQIFVTGITISGGNAISAPNGTLHLAASVSPSNASIKSILWSVNDSSLASVDATGLVRAKADGNAVITALASDGSSVSSTHNITITNQPTPTPTGSPSATPAPTPTPAFAVNVVSGGTNTMNSFKVDFGNTKVNTIVKSGNNAGMTATFSRTLDPSKKGATIDMSGTVSDGDWIELTFTSESSDVVTKVFEYDSSTTDWSIIP